MRKTKDERFLIVVANFTPVVRRDYRIGVPDDGIYAEVFNSDAEEFGGSGVINSGPLLSETIPWHDRDASLRITVPPLAVIFLAETDCRKREGAERK